MHKHKVFTRYDYQRIYDIIQNGDVVSVEEARNIDTLKRDLDHSRLVDSREIRPNVVTMNSKFCLKNLGNGKKRIYSLVFPNDCKDADTINVFSGMGMQILGSTIGTVIKSAPASDQYFVIEEIVYQPEAAGHYHL
jgi:regulator of nucleoside diphosphate kinase